MPIKITLKPKPPVAPRYPEVQDRVKILKEHLIMSKIKHEDHIMKLAIKEAHVYCVINKLTSQQYGPLLERCIRTRCNYQKNNAQDCTGDCSKDGKNSEIKVSLGGSTHTKFNFVQIRPTHECDYYILTAYHLSSDNVESEGELYIFKLPKENIKHLIVSYGGYAHGTIKQYGAITEESLSELNKEYALRPTFNDECWNALMPFRVPEADL
jgi:hypothetical protein